MTPQQWQTLGELLLLAAGSAITLLLRHALLLAWIAWWLWGANWSKIWPVLARGAWVPAVLVIGVSALVWSRMQPTACNCLGFVTVPNFWWQLGDVSMWAAVALFCGWLQGVMGWTPTEIDLEPPAAPAGGHHH